MAVDWRWMTKGGVLLDSTGDIAFTQSPWECLRTMVESRLKAALDGWQQYRIGADFENVLGKTVSQELEATIQRQAETALSTDFLPLGFFTLSILPLGNDTYQLYVFVKNQMLTSMTVNA